MNRIAALLLIALALPAHADIPLAERRSGYEYMSRETRAMQDDDTTNPATLWRLDGESLWARQAGTTQRACSDCHGDAGQSMRGVAARHPAYDAQLARAVTLEQRILRCRSERQGAPALSYESHELLSLATYVAAQSRGMPVVPDPDERSVVHREAGRTRFHLRQGQLNLSCAQCHDRAWGRLLGGTPIPQAHPTGYPLYRLEWQGVGSLQRRMRSCLVGVRAEPYDYGAPEYVELELYLMWRARGMPMESPAVRP